MRKAPASSCVCKVQMYDDVRKEGVNGSGSLRGRRNGKGADNRTMRPPEPSAGWIVRDMHINEGTTSNTTYERRCWSRLRIMKLGAEMPIQ
jgi:hypothetical protein